MIDLNSIDDEDKRNRFIIYDFLVKQYLNQSEIVNNEIIEKAQELADKTINSHSKNLFGYHGLAWQLGKINLEFFNMYFLQNIFMGADKAEISKTHKEIWKEIENIILGKEVSNRKLYICPRSFGKTTFISQSSAIWSVLYKYKRFVMLCSAIGGTADEFLNNIRKALEDNKRIEKAFGKIYDPKHYTNNNEIIDLANDTRIQSISASSVFRGKNFGSIRPELVILDDYQKDDEVATADQREKKWQRFQNDVMKSIQQNTCTLIACGTIQHKECFYSRLLNDPTWLHRFEKAVLVDNVDELFNTGLWSEFKTILFNGTNENRLYDAKQFYYDHEKEMQYPLLWSEFWSCLKFALDYYSNPVSFKQEYQNDVNNIGEKRFKTIITEKPEVLESHIFQKTLLAVDPASSTGKANDYSAFAVLSSSDNSIKYCRKGEIFKINFDDYIKHTIELLKAFKDITHIYIEKNLYMGADVVKLKEIISNDTELCDRRITFINEMQKKNKFDKIDSIVGDVTFGRVILNESDKEALEQLKDYQGSTSLHDDFPDCLSEAIIRIDAISVIYPVKFIDKRILFKVR